MSIPMPHPFCTCTPPPSHLGCFASVPHSPHPLPTLSLQLLLQLVEKTPVGALSDELLGTALDHANLVQTESIEAQGVLRVVGAPAGVGEGLDHLQSDLIVRLVALGHDGSGGLL